LWCTHFLFCFFKPSKFALQSTMHTHHHHYQFLLPIRNGDLDLLPNDPKINRVLPFLQGNHVAKFGKDPIYRTKVIVRKYFGVMTIIPFDNLYRWAYFVMHTLLVYYGVTIWNHDFKSCNVFVVFYWNFYCFNFLWS
jgi:hypothetical protein